MPGLNARGVCDSVKRFLLGNKSMDSQSLVRSVSLLRALIFWVPASGQVPVLKGGHSLEKEEIQEIRPQDALARQGVSVEKVGGVANGCRAMLVGKILMRVS